VVRRSKRLLTPSAGDVREIVVVALIKVVQKLPIALRRSLTWDRGTELATHAELAVAAGRRYAFHCLIPFVSPNRAAKARGAAGGASTTPVPNMCEAIRRWRQVPAAQREDSKCRLPGCRRRGRLHERGVPWKGAIPQWEVYPYDRWLSGQGRSLRKSIPAQVAFLTELQALSRVSFA
jgi:hypothetical protein